jgi:hypothetical protein
MRWIDKFYCTCGDILETEEAAVEHVKKFHATKEQRSDGRLLKSRVLIWISYCGQHEGSHWLSIL